MKNKTFLKSEDKHTHIQNTPSPKKKFKKKIKQHKHEQQNKKAHSFLKNIHKTTSTVSNCRPIRLKKKNVFTHISYKLYSM